MADHATPEKDRQCKMSDHTIKAEKLERSTIVSMAALFLMHLIVYMDRNTLPAVLVPVQERFEIDDGAAGLLLGSFSASFLVTLPIISWLCNHMLRKYLLAIGMAICGIATFSSGLATSYEQLLVARSLAGVAEATCGPLGPVLIAELFPSRHRGRALAVFYLAIPVGAALGNVLGGQIATLINWRWAFYFTGMLGIAGSLSAFMIREPSRQLARLS